MIKPIFLFNSLLRSKRVGLIKHIKNPTKKKRIFFDSVIDQ
jgi:hypothetical protein